MSPPAVLAAGAVSHRLLLVLGCLAFICCSESIVQRRFPDEEVLANLEYYPTSWAKHYKDGDAGSCGKAYSDRAALHVTLSEQCDSLAERTGWKDGMVVRGTRDITDFWAKAIEVLGDKYITGTAADNRDWQEHRFVVDDDTVIVEGKVVWGGATGRRLAQTWKRHDTSWKIVSEMIRLEEYVPPAPPPPTTEPKGAVEAVEKIVEAVEGKKGGDKIAAEALEIGKAVVEEVAKEAPVVAEAAKDAEKKEEASKEAHEDAVEFVAEDEKHSNFGLMFVCAAGLSGVGAFLYRKNRRRQEATIAGFEAMLG